jgi:hypothetical protein
MMASWWTRRARVSEGRVQSIRRQLVSHQHGLLERQRLRADGGAEGVGDVIGAGAWWATGAPGVSGGGGTKPFVWSGRRKRNKLSEALQLVVARTKAEEEGREGANLE